MEVQKLEVFARIFKALIDYHLPAHVAVEEYLQKWLENRLSRRVADINMCQNLDPK